MIQLFHVYKSYTGNEFALRDITLEIEKGEFVFITGASGAGKTTLLKLIFLEEKPTSGQILIAGKNVARIKESSIPYLRREMGFVFQDFRLVEEWTVYENVAIALRVNRLSEGVINRKVKGVLKLLDLDLKINLPVIRLSGGEKQRVAIARAIVKDPIILLADEPTGNLDPQLSREIMKIFEEINARGTCVVVATHDPSIIKSFPKRVIKLEKGAIKT